MNILTALLILLLVVVVCSVLMYVARLLVTKQPLLNIIYAIIILVGLIAYLSEIGVFGRLPRIP